MEQTADVRAPYRIGVIGMGHVGQTLTSSLENRADTVCYDRASHQPYPDAALGACDVVAICVDTPSGADGACDVTNVVDAVAQVPNDRIWLRSTVAPGTTDELARKFDKRICFSPEYHGQGVPVDGFSTELHSIPFLVVGGAPAHRSDLLDVLVPLLGADKTYFECSALEAEIVKYMENAFLATKVTFANEFQQICQRFGARWSTVREGWLLDPRIGASHSEVHGPVGGYAGACLPKDMAAIIDAAARVGYDADLLRSVVRTNDRIRAHAPPPPS